MDKNKSRVNEVKKIFHVISFSLIADMKPASPFGRDFWK